ncbi:MAG: hypothetical protein A07HB70_00210, partial [uncultured archaeon A07HB70]
LGLDQADFDLAEAFASTGTRRAVQVRTAVDRDATAAEDGYRLRFALPPGSYATVLCREYLKTDPARL